MTPRKNTPVIGYCRVSSEEQGISGLGLEAQEAAIRAACDSRGWQLLEIVQEVGSGRDVRKRPLLRDLLDRLEAKDAPARTIVVAKLDRLTRSVADGGRLFERAKDHRWDIVALDLGVDTTTASGELVANLMIAVGQWERRAIGERTSAALRAKRERGERVGRPPSIPPEIIDRMRSMKRRGMSASRIASELNAQGSTNTAGNPWTKRHVEKACIRYKIPTARRKK